MHGTTAPRLQTLTQCYLSLDYSQEFASFLQILVKETIQGAAASIAIEAQLGATAKLPKAGPALQLHKGSTNVPDSCLSRNNVPFKLSCCSLPSSAGRRNSVWSSWGHQQHKALAFTKIVEVRPYPGTTACHSPVWRERNQNGRARKQRSGVTNT